MDRLSRITPLATLGLTVLVVLIFVSAAVHNRPARSTVGLINDYIGRPAFDFTLPDLERKPFTLSAAKGRVVVLDLWATWCPPCIEELPTTSSIAARYADKGVIYKAINVGDPPDLVREFLQQQKLNVPVLLDEDYHVGELYGAQYIPLVVVIGPDGVILAHDNLNPDEVEKTLPAWIESALKSGQALKRG